MIFLLFLLVVTLATRTGAVQNKLETQKLDRALKEAQTEEVSWKYVPLSGPTIDLPFSANISSQIGKTAVLNCRIRYGGGKTVSWIRTRDLHLLTVGRFTYTSDDRFKAIHQSGSEDWMLKIHYVQRRDHGGYECQVATTPPISYTIFLQVIEPETRILGEGDIHIHAGSTINLTCLVRHSSKAPNYMLWYHGKELLSYNSPRGGITVVTESTPSNTSSRLLIQRASPSDAGKYSCKPASADAHSITVHVIPDENQAAIHHANGSSSSKATVATSGSAIFSDRHMIVWWKIFLCLIVNIGLLSLHCNYYVNFAPTSILSFDKQSKMKDCGEIKNNICVRRIISRIFNPLINCINDTRSGLPLIYISNRMLQEKSLKIKKFYCFENNIFNDFKSSSNNINVSNFGEI